MLQRTKTGALAVALAATGLATSALLGVRALTGGSACGVSGGCDVVQASAWSSVLGVPLSAWGVGFFVLVLAALLGPRPALPRSARWLVALGGLVGGGLLLLQLAVIGAVCPFCVCVDISALGLGIIAALGHPLAHEGTGARPAWQAAVALVIVGALPPVVLDRALHPAEEEAELPPPEPTPADVARIVEFVDIECPFCRRQHARLAEVLAAIDDERVEVELHHVPLPMHPHAREAARVACCGEEQGLGPELMDALMAADDLTPDGCRRSAAAVGAELDDLDACLQSERPDQRIADDLGAAERLGVRNLPTCIIGDRRMVGLQSADDLRDAIETALADCAT